MPYSKEEIKHLAFVRKLREKNAVRWLSDRDVYLTKWINNPASSGGQENYAGQANYGWESNNGKLLPGQVLNMAPKTEVNGRMVYNLYQDSETGNIQQGITFLSRQVLFPNSATPSGYDVELTVNFVETINHSRDIFDPSSAVKVIDNRFKEVDYITSGTSTYTTIADTTSDTTSGDTGSTSSTTPTGGGGGSGTYDVPILDT
jgi:hypothetical protein